MNDAALNRRQLEASKSWVCNGVEILIYKFGLSVLFLRGFIRTFVSHCSETASMFRSDLPLTCSPISFSTVWKSSICLLSQGASSEALFCGFSNGNICPPFWITSFSTFPASAPPSPPTAVPVRITFSSSDGKVLIGLEEPNIHKTFGRTLGRFKNVRTISGQWKRCVIFSTSRSGATKRALLSSGMETEFDRAQQNHASSCSCYFGATSKISRFRVQ